MFDLSSIGLVLDLIGVSILGVDLIGVQSEMAAVSKRNKVLLVSAFKGSSKLSQLRAFIAGDFAKSITPDGKKTIAIEELYAALDEMKKEIGVTSEGVGNLINYAVDSVEQQEKAAHKSLKLSYLGLFLIVVGFGFQLAANFVGGS